MKIRCVALGFSASGEMDFFPGIIELTQEQYENGEHYVRIEEAARDDDYEEPISSCDETGPAGKLLLPLFEWEDVPVYKVKE